MVAIRRAKKSFYALVCHFQVRGFSVSVNIVQDVLEEACRAA
jgi:hypothetical protein